MSRSYEQFLSGSEHLRRIVGTSDQSSPIPEEFVIWAYRLFLDREPDNNAVVADKIARLRNSRQLRDAFLASEEFRAKNDQVPSDVVAGRRRGGVPMVVEGITDEEAMVSFFSHVQQTWQALGEAEPHWSVLSADQFRQNALQEHLVEFYESGAREVEGLVEMLARNGLELPAAGSCLEYGCGVGRVTRWLAPRFARAWGCDISASHLALAKDYVTREGVTNVEFLHITGLSSIQALPPMDFFYSVIVLQHNPPPIIELVLKGLLSSLREGGIGVFQVPIYRRDYVFKIDDYVERLKNPDSRNIEMHLLPQPRVFDLIANAGCIPVEVFEDEWAGPGFLSNTFVVRKPVSA